MLKLNLIRVRLPPLIFTSDHTQSCFPLLLLCIIVLRAFVVKTEARKPKTRQSQGWAQIKQINQVTLNMCRPWFLILIKPQHRSQLTSYFITLHVTVNSRYKKNKTKQNKANMVIKNNLTRSSMGKHPNHYCSVSKCMTCWHKRNKKKKRKKKV